MGEIGLEVMHAGSSGIPVVMLAGDTAASIEIRALIPQIECSEVKSGVGRTAGFTPVGTPSHRPRPDVERLDDRTWIIRGVGIAPGAAWVTRTDAYDWVEPAHN